MFLVVLLCGSTLHHLCSAYKYDWVAISLWGCEGCCLSLGSDCATSLYLLTSVLLRSRPCPSVLLANSCWLCNLVGSLCRACALPLAQAGMQVTDVDCLVCSYTQPRAALFQCAVLLLCAGLEQSMAW